MKPLREDPGLFAAESQFHTDRPDPAWVRFRSVRPHKEGLLVDIAGVTDRDQAEELRGTSLYLARPELGDLDPDEYWPDDLIGLPVFDTSGGELGRVDGVIPGMAQDRLVIAGPAGRFEIPFVTALVPIVEIDGRVVVDPPDGLAEQ